MDNFMEYVWYYLQILLYTLSAIVVCGFVVWGCKSLFVRMMGGGVGNKIVIGTSIIGTPVHELGHAIMCLIFGHRITELRLWQPRSADGTLGYVNHTYNAKNVYHVIGNLFIGIGPIFSGLLVLGLCLYYAFPASFASYTTNISGLLNTSATPLDMLGVGLCIIPNMAVEFTSSTFPIWGRILLVIVMLSVSLHINLSPADMKGALSAIPLYMLLILIIAIISGLLGQGAMQGVIYAVQMFNAYMMALFTVVLVFALLQLFVALVVWLIRLLRR